MVLPGVHGWTSCSWRTVAYDYARLRVRGGGVGRRGRRRGGKSCSPSVRASRSARVPLERRYGVSGAYAPMKRLSCVVSLTYACCRCDGFAVRVVTHDFACVGGVGGGSFRLPVCVSCLCDRRCLCCVCMCVVAWMLVCVFYVLAIFGFVGIFAHACLHVCSDLIGRVFEYL